jgi:hypothetical protein
LKKKCVDSRVNVNIFASTSVPFILTTVQVPNLAITHKKWITVRERMVSDIPAGGGKIDNLFLTVYRVKTLSPPKNFRLENMYILFMSHDSTSTVGLITGAQRRPSKRSAQFATVR